MAETRRRHAVDSPAFRHSGGEAGEGPALFARFAFPPNELGYCGPAGAEVLLEGGATGDLGTEVARRAKLFDGAWPYLQLIAECAGIADPLDARVVRAYWLGSELLDAVDGDAFAQLVQDSFGTQPGVPERLDPAAAGAGVTTAAGPHHGFHVLVIYPWIGLLGKGDVARSVLDQCRIRWGRVAAVDGDRADIAITPLRHDGGALLLDGEQTLRTRWAEAGHAFVHDLQPGEQVAVHWDWVCDRLSDDDVAELEARTAAQLAAANAWLARST